ncbi:MAG TPA: transketolase [Miltoncostaeaceae bacterium]|nr:transketolase [Miltoncostaeaceae bacterium]
MTDTGSTATTTAALASDELAITTVRTLAIDQVETAKSGHPGAPMGLAPVAWLLFTRHLRYSPSDPDWPNRDRFVLSAGHASALLYALLHLTGYDLPLDELKRFRQWESRTPGHPERGVTPGVEVTTGPLGQGFGNAVGLALAERLLAARHNRPGHEIVDHRTWFICSDGDLMEGISHEAASIAGFLGLERLIGIYDDNSVSLDGPTSLTFGEDETLRFTAYGWRVIEVDDGNDLEAIDAALNEAAEPVGRPTLIRLRTHIGYGAPHKQDTSAAHGSPLGPEEAAAAKRFYGWPEDSSFLVPDEVAAWAPHMTERGRALQAEWNERLEAYREAHPDAAAEFERELRSELPDGWDADIPEFEPGGDEIATRAASGQVLNALAARVPELVQGAADLSSSTDTTIKGSPDVSHGHFDGKNLRYGVREHAMGAISNGLACHGGIRPVASTFLMFYDYMKNTLRLAALMDATPVFVYTHDSVGLGEDGPTHQPIEHLAALRATPNLVTIRPADARETAAAWRVAISRDVGPVAMILSRQKLPIFDGPADVARGAYVLADGDDCVLIGTGSEVKVAVAARDLLAKDGISARVVSMPSWELFEEQDDDYILEVLGDGAPRVAIEAASTFGWERWADATVGIDDFGASAPGDVVLREYGITPEAMAETAKSLLS